MFDQIVALLRGIAETPDPAGGGHDERTLAAVALMIEAASLDGAFEASERAAIAGLVQRRFAIPPERVAGLIAAAQSSHDRSTDLYRFTRVVVDSFSHEERVGLIEMLWEVALADGHVDDLESNLLRRLAGLIGISDRECGAARKRVAARPEGQG